ncbi:MAG: bleomycin resistance protein [Maritimibacter sp.]
MDHATANLPARDFDATEAFYARLGFLTQFKGEDWMILKRDGVVLEFFPHPQLDPLQSWFSACLRLEDVDGFMALCQAADIPVTTKGAPRIHMPTIHPQIYMGALIDLDGSLLRIIQNEDGVRA